MNLKIFITLFLAVFVTIVGVGIVAPLLPVYAHELGAGAFQIGLIFGAFSLTRSLFVPYFGRLSDIRGKKPLLNLGMFLYFNLSFLYVFTSSIEALILLRLGQGLASAMIFPVAQAYVGLITPKDKEGFIMGLFNISLYGGLSIGPLLGGFVKDWFNIRVSFLCMGVLSLIGFFLCLFLLPREAKSKKGAGSPSRKPMRYMKLLKDPAVFSLFTFRLCFMICIGLIWAFLPLFANTRFHLSSSVIGFVVMINVLVSGIFQVPMGFLADRYSKRFLVTLGGLLGAASILYVSKASTLGELSMASALFGLAGGISFPAVMALGVIEGRRKDAMGSMMGVLALAHSLGMLIGPFLGGIVLHLYSFTTIFVFGTAILIAGTLIFLAFQRTFPEEMEVEAGR